MTTKSKTMAAVPEVVVYAKLELPKEIPKDKPLSEELSRFVLLRAQGEAVEIDEHYPLPILMAAFDVAHKVSPEMVLRLKNGYGVLIFDHRASPVIRDEDIKTISTGKKHEGKKVKKFVPESIIDLESIWKKFSADEDNLNAISKALKEAAKFIKPSMVTTLVGKAPALFFLLTQHLLYGKTGEIWYQESQTSSPIRITRL